MSTKRSYYFARRIPSNADANDILVISSSMSPAKIHTLYVEKSTDYETYIHNGPWILRPIGGNAAYTQNNLPKDLAPEDIWNMVREKIETSHVLVAIISSLSYGTIAEAAYATALNTVAVYILPDLATTQGEKNDLWFLFHMSLQTQHLWKDEDFTNVKCFRDYEIRNSAEYINFIKKIVPDFLSKR